MRAGRPTTALLLTLLAACDAAGRDPGRTASVQVADAQFVAGPLPAPSGGPEVVAVTFPHSVIVPGTVDERLQGSLAAEANAALIGVEGEAGHWIVPAGLPDVQVPDFPTFGVKLSFAADVPRGELRLLVVAVDDAGRAGPPAEVVYTIDDQPLPEGELVISLGWDVNADLDLHVVDADGVEIWAQNVNSYAPPPPGSPPPDPNAWMAGGILDFDSNARCVIDGRRRENVVWTLPPPPGRYVVRVDAFSMCGEGVASWTVTAVRSGATIGEARGTSLPSDAALPHGEGSGTLALEVEVE